MMETKEWIEKEAISGEEKGGKERRWGSFTKILTCAFVVFKPNERFPTLVARNTNLMETHGRTPQKTIIIR